MGPGKGDDQGCEELLFLLLGPMREGKKVRGMDFHAPKVSGRAGLAVGRLGVAGGCGAPAAAFEEAFQRGCNYFYWGSLRPAGMAQAIKSLSGRGHGTSSSSSSRASPARPP